MRRSLRPAITTALTACALLTAAPAAYAACAHENVEPNSTNLTAMRTATLCLLNAERTPRGLPALRENAQLTTASQDYSQLMVNRGFFAHVTPDGIDLVKRLTTVGYIPRSAAWTVGENLAWGTGGLATPKSIMAAWMDSPGHKENVLTADFLEVGLGIALGAPHSRTSTGAATYTTDFGRRGNQGAGSTPGPASAPATTARPPSARRPTAKRCRALRRARASRKLTRTERKRLARCRKPTRRAAR